MVRANLLYNRRKKISFRANCKEKIIKELVDNLRAFVYKSPFSHRVASELHRISVTLASAFGFESRRYSDAKWRQLMLYHSAPPGYERHFFAVYRVEEEWRKRNFTNREIQSRPSPHIVSSLPPHKLHTNSTQAPHFVRFLLAGCCLYAVCMLPVLRLGFSNESDLQSALLSESFFSFSTILVSEVGMLSEGVIYQSINNY